MSKTLLIARREYLAFVRTVGFWLSLLTVPLIAAGAVLFPVLLHQSAAARPVAVLDLSGGAVGDRLGAIVRTHEGALSRGGRLRLAPLPPGLTKDMTVAEAEAKLPVLVARDDAPAVVVAFDDGGQLRFHVWSDAVHKGDVTGVLQSDLNGLEAERLAQAGGLDPRWAQRLRDARADIVDLTPDHGAPDHAAPGGGGREHSGRGLDAGRVLGAIAGYISWTTIFSSSMILLGSVIEEKSSKMLEVLLASASTTSLLVGKVLGGAMVLLTVAAIWIGTAVVLGSYGLSLMKPDMLQAVAGVMHGLFSPLHLGLLLVYFVTGYLMYGVFFAAIGAFCETQKDAQTVMGPIMIVLMVPLMTLQAAFVPGEVPLVRYLSWVPFFSPFLMPLRLSGPLPWYDIAGTLLGMGIVAVAMIRMGGKAFRQGALTGVRLSWGALFGAGRKEV